MAPRPPADPAPHDAPDDDAAPRPRVLVCDDEPLPRRILVTHLGRNGFEVHAAADGIEACDVAARVRPDIVLLDLMLPKRDGYTVLLHLRGRDETRRTPVFIVSAEPEEAHAETAAALGASGFIQKPFDLNDLLERMQRTLAAGGPPAGGGAGDSREGGR